MSAATAIANLLYLYAERIDAGDLDGAAELFRRAEIDVLDRAHPVGHVELRAIWQTHVRLYPCGTPRTRHVVTNPIIDILANGHEARCRSSYVVLQAAEGLALQPIAAGRYHDRFARDEEGWYFTYRDYRMLDLTGDISAHLFVRPTID